MPATKPVTLSKRHDTKADREARNKAESLMEPKTALKLTPPAQLHGHKTAALIWKRLVGLFFEAEGTIVTAFDADLLVKYCMAEEELIELFELRGEIKKMWDIHVKLLNKVKPNAENMKEYFNALAQANALLQRFQGMDARLDGKRKLVFALAQSLYLTPRSRAGVAPTEKEPEAPESEIEKHI